MAEQPIKSKAHLQVVLMFVIILATILLGFFMMPGSQEERDRLLQDLGTTNHGTFLLPMAPVAELPLKDQQGAPWEWSASKPKWRLLIPANSSCDGECGELLYTTRQVHMRLGKYTHRVERMLLVTGSGITPQLQETIDDLHPYLNVVSADASAVSRWLAATNSPWQPGLGRVYLVDPAGMAMMVYDVSHSGNEMLEDLNHLLKYSAE